MSGDGQPGVIRRLFSRSDDPEENLRLSDLMRQETTGGLFLLVATAVALIWANSPWRSSYTHLSDIQIGPDALHLHLNLATWAADGLLAVFFFVVGLELKHELVRGSLRDPARAAIPIVAAISGMIFPALFYLVVQSLSADGEPHGWAVPIATDIAFALAVLAVVGSALPDGLRTFLLTLAVVDDLIAIIVIAIFFSGGISFGWLAAGLACIAVFAFLANTGRMWWWAMIPLAIGAWTCVHASGVHATIAGVLLGLSIPSSKVGALDHRIRPVSAGICVPVFAFFAAGVTVVGGGMDQALRDPVTIGVIVGLVLGKVVGINLATWLMAKLTRAELDEEITWVDMIGLGLLAGVGFTVSLLIGELAFGPGSAKDEHVKIAILIGSLLSAGSASIVLGHRSRRIKLST